MNRLTLLTLGSLLLAACSTGPADGGASAGSGSASSASSARS